jgi:Na+-translocating ferredoxin:NAD+ oxidoreductase RnfD subunit
LKLRTITSLESHPVPPSDVLAAPPLTNVSLAELEKRKKRWHSFQVVFGLAYLGIVLDIVTTALGVQKAGAAGAYEQNPLGSFLIGNAGWIGLFALLTAICAVFFVSFRAICWRMPVAWSTVLNTVLMLVTVFRWIAVVTAVLYLVQPA